MTWLGPSDQALCVLAYRLADEIQTAVDRADYLSELRDQAEDEGRAWEIDQQVKRLVKLCDVVACVDMLAPKLQAALTALGGTPVTRRALAPQLPEIGGSLAQLRANAGNNIAIPRPR